MTVSTVSSAPDRKISVGAALVLAFFAIYIVWGSTFFAIRILVEHIPPLLAAGMRFFTAGAILYGVSRLRGEASPTKTEWRNLALLGALMFLVTYSALFWAEKTVPSGIAAVLVATLPISTMLLETLVFRRYALSKVTAGAMVLGFVGVGILSWDPAHFSILPCLAILGGEMGWATGAVLSGSLALPKSKAITAGAEMALGGVMLLCFSLAAGELHTVPQFTVRNTAALVYLILFGSLFAFTAFVWLLSRMPATAVSSHAYVNPVVALALGHWLLREVFTARMLLGGLLILISVAFILRLKHSAH